MALSVETAEALVANYLDGRSLPEVVHKAAVQTTRLRLMRGDVPVLCNDLLSQIDREAGEFRSSAPGTVR
jgi:hypothetical protein